MTFPRTQIQPPKARPGDIARGPVEARLGEALATRRVVVVCAPAGYGKTSLAARACARLPEGHALAWISADPGDGLQRVLECLLAALEPLDPPWRTAPEALAQRVAGGADAERAVAAELINTLDAIEVAHGVIAIDDLHRIEDPALFRFLDRLVERLTPRWTLLLASRLDPPLALARLRAAGELLELRQLDLQFARDEARRLANEAGVGEALADRAFERTQGWPAGLTLALGAAAAEPRAGERPMFDFLITEVVDQLSPELAQFLMRVSVLPELEAARCAIVAGEPRAETMLSEIERLGLFVDTLDGPGRTLRLHDLFREALQQRLREQDRDGYAEARRRAADTEPDALRRIAMRIEDGALDEAAALALEHLPVAITTTGTAGPSQVLSRFPATYRERSPELLLVRGLVGWVHWDFEGMLESFSRAEAGFRTAGRAELESMAAAYRANVLVTLGRLEEAGRVLAALRGQPLGAHARIMALNAASWLAIDEGRLADVPPILSEMIDRIEAEGRIELWYQTSTPVRMPGVPGIGPALSRQARAMARAAGDTPTPLQPLAEMVQAWLALWRGDLQEAFERRDRARADAHWTGETGAVRSHLFALSAFLEVMAGDPQAALASAMARLRQRTAGRGPWHRYILALFGARIAAACGDPGVLAEQLREVEAMAALLRTAGTPPHRAIERPLSAQLAALEGRTDEAIAGWRDALRDESAIDLFGQAVETRVRLAAALAQAGRLREAAEALRPAFARAESDGGPGGALLARPELQRLAQAGWRGELTADEAAVLRAWCAAGPCGAAPAPADTLLTAREWQVLERIAAGESNKVIARALDLSLHTVKRHVANILGKLAVETRGQAAAWFSARKG